MSIDAGAQSATPVMPADHPPMMKAGTSPAAPRLASDTVLARIDGETITAGELDATIGAMRGPDRYESRSPEVVRELLDALIDRRLMARAARAAGMKPKAAPADSPASEPAEAALAEALLARELATVQPPSEQDIERYYREHAAAFTLPARVQVTRVVAATAEAATRAREELLRGATVDALRTGTNPGLRHVETLWLQDTPKKSQLVAIALELQNAEVSPVVAVATGFAVLRAEQTEAARLRPLAEVRAGIVAGLEAAARQRAEAKLRQQLRASARVTIDEAALRSYLPPPVTTESEPVR
ncbi:MAG: peptidylprolyl isomerase [Gammaproteobacteria bacterium]|nr:MAG: peptidylprolyl isomerase [Gammaproteobacteria bacterium]